MEEIKKEIKLWEQTFTSQHGKKPEKDDIKNAPENIKESYKKYWKLKKEPQALNNTKLSDQVWSTELNKAMASSELTGKSSHVLLKKYSEKLKKENNDFASKIYRSLKNQAKISLTPPLDISSPLEKIETSPNNKNEEKAPKFSLSSDAEPYKPISISKSVKVYRTPINYKPLRKVNILSTDVHADRKNNSHLSDLNPDWVKRCLSAAEFQVATSKPEEETLSNEKHVVEKNLSSQSDTCEFDSVSDDLVFDDHLSESDYQFHNEVIHEESVKESDPCFIPKKSPRQNLKRTRAQTVSVEREHVKLDDEDSEFKISQNTPKSPPQKKAKASHSENSTSIKLDTISTPSENKRETHLRRKISSGTLNENFVRLDIKKKMYARGHRKVNFRKMKWKKWKELKKNNNEDAVNGISSSNCFKCGQPGHWARNCKSVNESNLLPDCEEDFDSPLPTLEEAAELCKGIKGSKPSQNSVETIRVRIFQPEQDNKETLLSDTMENSPYDFTEENFASSSATPSDKIANLDSISPYLTSDSNDFISDEPQIDVYEALNNLGYSSFRRGQKEAVMRILKGLSTLVVLPTGSGKSLCYQLPAYLYSQKYKCISLVVSPLVSLMEDQVTGLASCIHAVCLHSNMTEPQKKAAYEAVKSGKAQILLVSPEAVISGRKFLPSDLPPIAFACIDEVHCVSEWSHNFRPSYLQLYKILTKKMNVKCILGLTATATKTSIEDIAHHLNLRNLDDSVIGNTNVPSNLHISISRDKDKDGSLLKLLKGDRFCTCSSIIIYCIRRDETERLATLIRTSLQDEEEVPTDTSEKKKKSKKKGRQLVWSAEAYHAGLQASRRRSIQKQFMSGKLRIVVATVAFGMGLDKADVHAVIHYNMPKSFESYVQEIGRAGRDGEESHCHVFLENEGKDLWELRRHIHSNGVDRHVIKKLIKKVFVPCKCKKLQAMEESSVSTEMKASESLRCPKHEIAFSIDNAVQELDLREESISTFLCYLELHENQWIELLAPTYSTCLIRCYGGAKQMHSLIRKCPAIAVSMAIDKQKGKEWDKSSQYQFEVINVASHMGWDSLALKRELRQLEWNDQNRKTGVIVEFSDLAFHCSAPGDLTDDDLDGVVEFLYNKVSKREAMDLKKLKSLNQMFHRYSSSHYWSCCDEVNIEHSNAVKNEIKKYFERCDPVEDENVPSSGENSAATNEDTLLLEEVQRNVRDIICINHDQNFNGRAIARIFHGIDSPCYPAQVWGKVRRFWRCHLNIDFHVILKMANQILRTMK